MSAGKVWRVGAALGVGAAAVLAVVLVRGRAEPDAAYDPTEYARAAGKRVENREATVPAACYTKTEGRSNPCWTCHTRGVGLNRKLDVDLQANYSFSEVAVTNR